MGGGREKGRREGGRREGGRREGERGRERGVGRGREVTCVSAILVPSLGWPGRLHVPATVGEQKRVRAMVQLFTSVFQYIIDYGGKNILTCTCTCMSSID